MHHGYSILFNLSYLRLEISNKKYRPSKSLIKMVHVLDAKSRLPLLAV